MQNEKQVRAAKGIAVKRDVLDQLKSRMRWHHASGYKPFNRDTLALAVEQYYFVDEQFLTEAEVARLPGGTAKYTSWKLSCSPSSVRNFFLGQRIRPEVVRCIFLVLGVEFQAQYLCDDRQPAEDFTLPVAEDVNEFHIQREQNEFFTGRAEVMEALCTAVKRSGTLAVTQALSGLGGMGKTATAIEYAYRCLDKANFPDYPRYTTTLFTRGDTLDVLKYGCANMANALQLHRDDPNNLDQSMQAVIRWMIRPTEAPWLLIIDNVDEPAILKEFLPEEPQRHFGHVLITSRSRRFGNRIKRVDIEPMEDEGVTFLYRRTLRQRIPGSIEEKAAKELVAEMGGLPLALEQAAAYMTNGIEMSFQDYVTSFKNQTMRSQQMMHAPEYGFYRQFEPKTLEYAEALTVLNTWHMSLATIEMRCPHAVQLLQLCAFLHPVGIPRELVIALLPDYFAPAKADAVTQNALYNSLLNVLTGYSLIQRDLDNSTHSVHILVQAVLQDGLTQEDQKQAYERILTAIARSFPSEDYVPGGRGALYYPHAERIRNHVAQTGMEGELVGLLLNHMAAYLYYQGRFDEAERLYQKTLEIRQKALRADHPDIATTRNNLAVLYWSQGRLAEAAPLFQQALSMRQKALPAGHPDIIESLNNLAALYQSKARYDDAEPLYLQSLEMKRKWLPEGYHTIAAGLNNLAKLYWRQRRFSEAEPLYLEALELTRTWIPDDYHIIGASLNNLAELYCSQERFAEAEPLFQQALQVWPKAFPEGHPMIAASLNNLALLYWSQGRLAEAEPLFQQALDIRRKTLPRDHPDITTSRNNLAELYRSQSRFVEADLLF